MATLPKNPETDLAHEYLDAVLAIYQHLDWPDQLEALLEQFMAWSGASDAFVLGAGEDSRKWVPLATTVDGQDPRLRLVGSLTAASTLKALGTGNGLFEGLGPLEPLLAEWPGPTPAAMIALPLLTPSDHRAGLLLLLLDHQPDEPTMERLGRLLDLARPALGHALKLQSIRDLVIRDDTAHCFNRRYFEEFVAAELSRAGRFRSSLSLIFLDMDNLKQVNNLHGHSMGSMSLREVSVRVRSKIRKFDKLFRFGGDEFCIILPETEWQGAMEVAERVRESIAGRPFLIRELGVGNGVPMSASLGVASYPLHARTQQELVQRADRAMQLIKGGTKNAIGVADVGGGDNDER